MTDEELREEFRQLQEAVDHAQFSLRRLVKHLEEERRRRRQMFWLACVLAVIAGRIGWLLHKP